MNSKSRFCYPEPPKLEASFQILFEKIGWVVDDVPVYQTTMPKVEHGSRDLLSTADAIVFTSSSTVKNFSKCSGKNIYLKSLFQLVQ